MQCAYRIQKALKLSLTAVLGPGSLTQAYFQTSCQRDIRHTERFRCSHSIYSLTQPKETENWAITWIGWQVSLALVIFLQIRRVPEEFLNRYSKIGAKNPCIFRTKRKYLESLGTTVIYGDFVTIKNGAYLRHNAQSLSEAIIRLARENREIKDF